MNTQREVIESSTNSEMGSHHWFHTLMARILHTGEYLKEKTPSEELLWSWGKTTYDAARELIYGFDTKKIRPPETLPPPPSETPSVSAEET